MLFCMSLLQPHCSTAGSLIYALTFSRVLDELLSDNETSANLERIFAYLSKLAENMRNAKIPEEKYEVSKVRNL